MAPRLRVEHLSKSYGTVTALDGLSLTVDPGEIVGLLGPNGAGKTTLVSIICGLRRADAGAVFVDGIDALAEPERARRHIGLAPQELGIYPIDTVRENLTLFARLVGLRGAAMQNEVTAVAEALLLEDLMDRQAGELSGGQKRRLHTALALVGRPPLVLLDEATVGADVESRLALISVIRDLALKGSAVLYSTHYLHEVEDLRAQVTILDRGRAIAQGSVSDLMASHGTAYIEMTFAGNAPDLQSDSIVARTDSSIRLAAESVNGDLGAILTGLGSAVGQLRNIEVINPSLETVFMSLTGRRYEPSGIDDVVAA